MRYEDILDDPEGAFSALVRFFGHTPDADILRGAIEASSFGRLKAMESEGGFREAPRDDAPFFAKGVANQWLTGLSAGQARRVIDNHEAAMRLAGYNPDAALAVLAQLSAAAS